MIDRVSTASAYNAVLSNLMQAEVSETNAGNQLSSSEQASDLQGYGGNSEMLIALQGTTTQVTGYLNNTQTVSAQLDTQSSALTEVASAAASASQAVTEALAQNNGTSLMSSLQDALSSAVDGLNTTYNGQYLFSGGQVNTPAVSATSLASLTSAPSIGSLFNNDQNVATTQLDSNTTVSTGFLASDVGTPLFTALQAIEAFNQGPNGPLTGMLTTTQAAFLTSQVTSLSTAEANLNNVVAQNGQVQTEVTNVQGSLTSQQTMLQGLVSNMTDANLAQASTNLQQAQLSIQAAGQVFQALNASSLLNSLGAVPSVG